MNAAALPAGGPPGRAIGADAAVDPGAATGDRVAAAWRALALVEDPEIPALTLVDLGIVRFVTQRPDDVLEVGLSPTYTGCPATEFIRGLVAQALAEAEVGEIAIRQVLAPAWSSDWITSEGRRKLAAYGIVPPSDDRSSQPIACPRCNSIDTERISQFGSTPCKSLHRCRQCLEPFECFKCI